MRTITDIDRLAPIISRHERRIEAPLSTIWALHTSIANWPKWNNDIRSAHIDGPFEIGRTFRWNTVGIEETIVSTIHQIEPGRRTLWGGPAMAIMGLHEWQFAEERGATVVTTSESWSGSPVDHDKEALTEALAVSLERWLSYLEQAAGAQ